MRGQGQDDFQKKDQDEEASGQQHSGGQQHSSLPHPVAGTSHLPAPAQKVKRESMKYETGVKQEDIQHQTPVKQESVKHEKTKQETGVNTGVRGVGCEETLVKACQKTAIKAEQSTLCGSVLGQGEQAMAQKGGARLLSVTIGPRGRGGFRTSVNRHSFLQKIKMPSAGRQRFTRGDHFDLLEKRIYLFSIFLSSTLF